MAPVSRLLTDTRGAVYTYAGERGRFADTGDRESIPEEARGLVRVILPGGSEPPPGMVWVTNLGEPAPGGGLELRAVPREAFEELVLGDGRKSAFRLPEGLDLPQTEAAPDGGIVVYKTEWCGVCRALMAYLDRKGVHYLAKDVEKDRSAAAELLAKTERRGIRPGSVPVIDVGGELIVGFDRTRLERLLAAQ